jgi:5-methylcytosine-specific restriction endonuclease McrA
MAGFRMRQKRLYDRRRWRRRSEQLRDQRPLCERCRARGLTVAAEVAHHIEPHQGNEEIFWSSPLEALCKACHDSEAQQQEKLGFSTTIGYDGWPLDAMHPANKTV